MEHDARCPVCGAIMLCYDPECMHLDMHEEECFSCIRRDDPFPWYYPRQSEQPRPGGDQAQTQ